MLKNMTINQDMPVLICQPVNYPEKLVSVMCNFFSSISEVEKAYLACLQYPQSLETFRLLIGLQVNNNFDLLINKLGKVLSEEKIVESLDFVEALASPFKAYFLKINPFYVQKKG